jgi:N-acetylglucosamine-6-phosphate deacetylase
VTGFLPTVCPLPKGEDAQFLSKLANVRSEGTEILGFHLEGPFLAITGALPPEAVGRNDAKRAAALIEAAQPYAAIFSISPELDGIKDLLPILTAGGKPVFITHTKAGISETQNAIEGGARHATHFYDVFYAPEESEPGVRPCGAVEAILADPRVSVDFILDGEHVNPVAVRMALQCKGPDRVCLVTDANIGAGLPPDCYHFGGEEVEFTYLGGPARFTQNSRAPGGLAGSGLTMDQAVRNAIRWLEVDLHQAIRMAAANPARVLGLDHVKGTIAEGFDADLVLLDRDLNVQKTWVGGQCVFSA